MHCGQLIPGKISKFDSTRCQIIRLKYTKFDFHWGYAPDPAWGAYTAPKLYLRGPTCKGSEVVEGRERKEREGRRGEGICWTSDELLPTRLLRG